MRKLIHETAELKNMGPMNVYPISPFDTKTFLQQKILFNKNFRKNNFANRVFFFASRGTASIRDLHGRTSSSCGRSSRRILDSWMDFLLEIYMDLDEDSDQWVISPIHQKLNGTESQRTPKEVAIQLLDSQV